MPTVDAFAYTYDALKRKTAEADAVTPANSQTFSYDDQSRLTAWQRRTGVAPADPVASAQDWTLSLVGDWTKTITDGVTQNRTHNAVHEVTKVGSSNLLYDFKGNLTRDEDKQVSPGIRKTVWLPPAN